VIGPFVLAALVQVPASPPAVVTVTPPEEQGIQAGGRAEARVVVKIKEGFHVQANPASEPFLVPARLEVRDDERLRAGPPRYPTGKPYRLRGSSRDLSTYEGTFVIRLPLAAALGSRPGMPSEPMTLVLEGALHYQACDDRVCLKPSSVPVRVPVRIEPKR